MLTSTSTPIRERTSSSTAWLAERGLRAPSSRWSVAIGLDIIDPRMAETSGIPINTHLQIAIDANEWGVFFCHGSGSSWIRVTNAPRVHERDDFDLLPLTSSLRSLGIVVQALEERFNLSFRRPHATIRTNLDEAHHKILMWVVAAL